MIKIKTYLISLRYTKAIIMVKKNDILNLSYNISNTIYYSINNFKYNNILFILN